MIFHHQNNNQWKSYCVYIMRILSMIFHHSIGFPSKQWLYPQQIPLSINGHITYVFPIIYSIIPLSLWYSHTSDYTQITSHDQWLYHLYLVCIPMIFRLYIHNSMGFPSTYTGYPYDTLITSHTYTNMPLFH